MCEKFFYQYTIVDTILRELQHPQHDNLPPELKPIAYIIRNHHNFLQNKEALSSFLDAIGYIQLRLKT